MNDDVAWPLAQHVCRTGYATDRRALGYGRGQRFTITLTAPSQRRDCEGRDFSLSPIIVSSYRPQPANRGLLVGRRRRAHVMLMRRTECSAIS